MRCKYLFVFLFTIIQHQLYTGCSSNDKTNEKPIKKSNGITGASIVKPSALGEYDLDHPTVIRLPPQLDEISGISFYPKDTSLFCITDEDGMLYKIHVNRNYQVESWRFSKARDFEDVVLHDSIFYVLVSNGDIEQLTFNRNSLSSVKAAFPGANKKAREFETLYYDDKKGLVLICKQCKEDGKKTVSAFGYAPATGAFSPAFKVSASEGGEQPGAKQMQLKPSAAAINPATNELYILCSVNRLLVITDRNGMIKRAFSLDSKIYKQPEGIAFTPAGHMIISNEFNEEGSANLLIVRRK